MSYFLLYEDKGTPTIFEIVPNYVKGDRFSAKIIETNKSRSFAFSMIYGLYDSKTEADEGLQELEALQLDQKGIENLEKELEVINVKIDATTEKHECIEEKIYKKEETLEDLEYRDSLTPNQRIRISKLTEEIDKLRNKETELDTEIEKLSDEMVRIEDAIASGTELTYEQEKALHERNIKTFKNKISELKVEIRIDPPKVKKINPEKESKTTLFGKFLKLLKR